MIGCARSMFLCRENNQASIIFRPLLLASCDGAGFPSPGLLTQVLGQEVYAPSSAISSTDRKGARVIFGGRL